jgi:hypothetical protein
MSKTSNKVNVDSLAEMFGLTAWDKLDDLNIDYFGEGLDWSEEGEEEALKIEAERRDALYSSWHGAVLHAAEQLFGEHGLKLEPLRFKRKVPEGTRHYEYRVVPETSWEDAANKVRETINGVGFFYFATRGEFLRSGPYTAREAVLGHLHWVKRYPDVYGGISASRMYEAQMR